MIPIDSQVTRSNGKVKGHVGLPKLVQLITHERFAQEASNLVCRYTAKSATYVNRT